MIEKEAKTCCCNLESNHSTDCFPFQVNETVTNCNGLDCYEKSFKLKDSGIPWIGQIPEHWNASKIGQLYDNRYERVSDRDYEPLSVTMQGILPQLETAAKTDDGDNRKLVRKGDFAINSRSDRRGSCGISPQDGSVSLINLILAPRTSMDAGYYNWLFHTSLFADEFYSWGHGIVADLWTTRWQEMKNIAIPVPPKEEQERIAVWLDAKCGEIDELVEVEQQMISDLEAYRQAVITEAVTHGLDPNTPTINSNNEWIGNVPKNWETIPVQHFFEFRNGYTPSKSDSSFWTNGSIPWYRMEDIRKSGRRLKESIQYITPEAVKNGGMFEAGSYIMAMCTASIGEHAILIVDSLANQRFINLKVRKSLIERIDRQYIYYYMFILGRFCRETAIITTFPFADITQVRNFIVPTPPLSEQQAIAEYLDAKCAEIDNLIKIKQEKIETLKQYRQSLIFEAVTGKTAID